MEKTNVMRILDQKKIKYNEYFYGDTNAISGVEVAKVLNEDASKVFKTLVTIAKSKQNYVFMIPVEKELDLKKCAQSVNENWMYLSHWSLFSIIIWIFWCYSFGYQISRI